MSQSPKFNFDNSYANLSDKLFTRQHPTPVKKPELIKLNDALAEQLNINPAELRTQEGIAILAGNALAEGSDPLAMAYAGHQFGHFVPQLGDGRAVLLGEVIDKLGERYDIQLKGSGPTPYSRNGDGRAAIGPVIREYIVSEAMSALGIPTTRALAAVTTGESVFREEVQAGAVLTRVAQSHIRVGTFQYFTARGDTETVEKLIHHVIDRHYPEASQAENPALALLEAVLEKQAALITQWQSIGFIHGVMNTDNASIAGITIDYGPCAFMDNYHPDTVFSSIDRASRYAYKNQPGMAQWNTANLAQCLLPLIDKDEEKSLDKAQSVIDSFPAIYVEKYLKQFNKKIGLLGSHSDDESLVSTLLQCMTNSNADFTNTFRALSHCSINPLNPNLESSQVSNQTKELNITGEPQNNSEDDSRDDAFLTLFGDQQDRPREWLTSWRERHAKESASLSEREQTMLNTNPAYIPRNHRIAAVIDAASEGNYTPMNELIDILSTPFEDQPERSAYTQPPTDDEVIQATFCGT